MMLTFPAHIISLVRFGHTVFLPCEEHQKLDAEIDYIELLTRPASRVSASQSHKRSVP